MVTTVKRRNVPTPQLTIPSQHTPAPAADAPAPQVPDSQQPAPQAPAPVVETPAPPATNGRVLGKSRLIKGTLPQIQGRGKAAKQVPPELAAELAETLGGEDVGEFSGTIKQITAHKNMCKKWAEQQTEAGNPVKVHFVTTEGRLPNARGEGGTDTATIQYAAVEVEVDEVA